MACSYDFVERLHKDLSVKIFMCMYHSGILAKCCAVSKSWRRFVIENGLCKKFCLNLCPGASRIIDVVEVLDKPERVCRSETLMIDEVLERNHRTFSLLGIYLATFQSKGEIEKRICASSYGRVPDEEVTSKDDFDYSPIDDENPTYWSSKGNSDPSISETVVFKTIRNLCIIKEIHVQPFEGNYEPDFPVYSAKAVRFSFGCRSPFIEEKASHSKYYDDDMFIWTYTSPECLMFQYAGVQVFHLPRPIFCIGGIIKMELLGRVKKNRFDGLYYVRQFSEMRRSYDFVERLHKELSVKILMSVSDTSTLAQCCAVSKLWRRFVIENGLCKKFCLNLCPEASKFVDVSEVLDKPERVCRSVALKIDEVLERNHRVFSFLGEYLDTYQSGGQVEERICASTYGRVPDEPYFSEDDYDYSSVDGENPAYWSSTGTRDPNIPETVVYKTICNLCIIKEIQVQPFVAKYEPDFPIYSAKAVRFSFGCRSPFKEENTSRSQHYEDDMFIWTYTSPEFSASQEAVQNFHLPRPIFCIGGIIKMEILGRAQKNSFDGLYYVSVDDFEAIGRYVCGMFDFDVVDDTGNCILKCNWEHVYATDATDATDESDESAEEDEFCQCSP